MNSSQKKYYEKNKARILAYNRSYYFKNKTKIRAWNNNYQMQRARLDPLYRIRRSLRRRFLLALNGKKKYVSIIKLLGCSIEEFKTYIESKFQPGMTWENHGKWHLDHIKPCVSFNLLDIKQQAECFHYTNFQPLWALDNEKKGGFCVVRPS